MSADDEPGRAPVVDPFEGPAWAAPRTEQDPQPGTQRVRVSRRRKRRRRRIAIGSGVLAIAVLGAVAWLLYTGLKARTELEAVRSEVHTLRAQIAAGSLDAARATSVAIQQHAHRADDLTDGAVWGIAAHVPFLGDPLETVRTVTSSIDAISDNALPALIHASSELNPQTLRRADGTFDLTPLTAIAPSVDTAARSMQAALQHIDSSPSDTWLGTVNSARSDLLDQLTPLTHTISNASVAADTLPEMLGANGPRRYLVAFEGEGELRGTGGLVGALAVLKADHGKLTFERFESDGFLEGTRAGLDFGNDYTYLYSPTAEPTTVFSDNDVSPHFPYAAKLWLADWKQKTGEQLDGALAIDPTALSYMLAVTGPVHLADGTTVTAANVVRLTQQTAYVRFAHNNNKRKEFLLDIARASSEKFVTGSTDTTALVQAAAKAIAVHRLLVWSTKPQVQERLAASPIGGVVPDTAAPYVGLALNSAVAGKLDYYLHTSLDVDRSTCGSTTDVTVTIRLTNEAPANLPRYVYVGTVENHYPAPPGTNRMAVLYYATRGASFDSATLNGKQELLRSGLERGHPVLGDTLYLPRGQTQTLVIHLTEPSGSAAPITRIQPVIHPVETTIEDHGCGS
jgi:hypothetical protein